MHTGVNIMPLDKLRAFKAAVEELVSQELCKICQGDQATILPNNR